MLEEAPSGPPQEIVVKAMGSEAMKITWMVRMFYYLLLINGRLFSLNSDICYDFSVFDTRNVLKIFNAYTVLSISMQ
jgi:hypothetical protein